MRRANGVHTFIASLFMRQNPSTIYHIVIPKEIYAWEGEKIANGPAHRGPKW